MLLVVSIQESREISIRDVEQGSPVGISVKQTFFEDLGA